ncbi:hypothetical protein DPMN_028158 [Dreissena polymorpha]|uniref:Peptidase A2 domain-containing protein n=1 Tax=Dreissena polymorpha TaxID=45954 RepID=A0A9D4LWL8_DREPO|nr:hypothetical protein DPMN_028158 [Dreissena polymorpha]
MADTGATKTILSDRVYQQTGVLAKFAGTFSRDDWDLGLTHLLEHSINNGDAAPV